MPECYIRGNYVKSMRIEEDVITQAEEEERTLRKKVELAIGAARGFRGRGKGTGRGRGRKH